MSPALVIGPVATIGGPADPSGAIRSRTARAGKRKLSADRTYSPPSVPHADPSGAARPTSNAKLASALRTSRLGAPPVVSAFTREFAIRPETGSTTRPPRVPGRGASPSGCPTPRSRTRSTFGPSIDTRNSPIRIPSSGETMPP